MISSARMAAVDRNAEALGVPRRQLMESSGNAVARRVKRRHADGTVFIVAGRGNNGGDAFVAARFLDDYDVTVRLLGSADRITTDIAAANWEALERGEFDTDEWRDSSSVAVPDVDLVIDAVVGTGVTGALREPAATASRAINAADADVISVDVPSGVDADTGDAAGAAVEPDEIVTFHDTKPGLAELEVPVHVADIGIPAAAELFVEVGDLRDLSRDPDSHKGQAGRIFTIGGGPYTGAPALTATAALRAGADLSYVACPEVVAGTVAGYGPDLIVRGLSGECLQPEHVQELLEEAEDMDVIVLGPGLGNDPATLEAVRAFLEAYDGRCVVDADALSTVPETTTAAELICTPHMGEFVDMGGERADDWRDRLEQASRLAAELGVTLLLKGRYDVVTDGDRTRVNRTGNPGMTVGGTGDVLAGIVAACFTQAQRSAVTAGAIGSYVNGAAGDRVAQENNDGLVASDLLDAIPTARWPE